MLGMEVEGFWFMGSLWVVGLLGCPWALGLPLFSCFSFAQCPCVYIPGVLRGVLCFLYMHLITLKKNVKKKDLLLHGMILLLHKSCDRYE